MGGCRTERERFLALAREGKEHSHLRGQGVRRGIPGVTTGEGVCGGGGWGVGVRGHLERIGEPATQHRPDEVAARHRGVLRVVAQGQAGLRGGVAGHQLLPRLPQPQDLGRAQPLRRVLVAHVLGAARTHVCAGVATRQRARATCYDKSRARDPQCCACALHVGLAHLDPAAGFFAVRGYCGYSGFSGI